MGTSLHTLLLREEEETLSDRSEASDPEQELSRITRRALITAYGTWWKVEQKEKGYAPLMRGQLAYILAHPGLSATEKIVLLSIANRTSRQGEAAGLSVGEIANGAGLRERATQLALKRLCTLDVLRRIQFHGNRAANYYLVPPGAAPAVPAESDVNEEGRG